MGLSGSFARVNRDHGAAAERSEWMQGLKENSMKNRDEEKALEKALLDHVVRGEAGKTYKLKVAAGFIKQYLSGGTVLDVGFRGHVSGSVPITPYAVGVDLDFPGYDGNRLPFADETVD